MSIMNPDQEDLVQTLGEFVMTHWFFNGEITPKEEFVLSDPEQFQDGENYD